MSNEPKSEFEKELDQINKALCGNNMTQSVADFLTDLYARVRKLEEPTL